jgi:hypothetical protein
MPERENMIRQSLHLMLVFALFANQAAICGAHSHHDSEPSGHSARAHVHLFGHSHGGDSHHHHDSNDHQHSNDQQPAGASEAGLDSSLPNDHDSDALFFGDQDDFQNQSSRLISKELIVVDVWLAFEYPSVGKQKSDCQSWRTHAGPFSTGHCAIYLQTSRLLI